MTYPISAIIFSSIILFIPCVGLMRKIDIYDCFLEGGKKAFPIVINIIPAIVGMYVGIGMLRASGFFDVIALILQPAFQHLSISTDIIPLSLMRPISGSGSIALFAETIDRFGPDSIEALTSATILGSTETTFYVIAVYFGAIGIKRYRYAVTVGLLADLAGIIASIAICQLLFA